MSWDIFAIGFVAAGVGTLIVSLAPWEVFRQIKRREKEEEKYNNTKPVKISALVKNLKESGAVK
jgi:hypothetical protein